MICSIERTKLYISKQQFESTISERNGGNQGIGMGVGILHKEIEYSWTIRNDIIQDSLPLLPEYIFLSTTHQKTNYTSKNIHIFSYSLLPRIPGLVKPTIIDWKWGGWINFPSLLTTGQVISFANLKGCS